MPKNDPLTAYEAFLNEYEYGVIPAALLPFYESVQSLNEAFSPLHRRDKYGRMPKLSAEARDQMLRLHETLGARAEQLIADPKVGDMEKDLVRKLSEVAASNYRLLQSYDPQKPRTLPDLLEEARTLFVDLRGEKLKDEVGSAQNKRRPLTFLDDQGKELTGVFTPKKHSNNWASIEKMLKDYAKKKNAPAIAKQYFPNLMRDLNTDRGARALGLDEKADKSARLEALHTRLVEMQKDNFGKGVGELLAALYSTEEEPLDSEALSKELGDAWGKVVPYVLAKHATKILNNNMIAKIHDGARLDNRNAAMSAVAELLNVPDLIAKSVPMRIVNAEGEIEEGTFMAEAKGTDVNNLKPGEALYDGKSLRKLDGRAMKAIADLQVLDFICGNTDRHAANVVYKFDPVTWKLIGVQGFDNDTAFGALKPKDGDFVAFLTMPKDMGAVSESMYQRLRQITPEILKFSLRGFGLTEEELDAAADRLKTVKEAIEAGNQFYQDREKEQQKQLADDPEALPPKQQPLVQDKIRVMKDEEWSSLSWDDLNREKQMQRWSGGEQKTETVSANFFTKARNMVSSIPAAYKKQIKNKPYVPLRSEKPIGSRNRALPDTLRKELEYARTFEDILDRRTKRFHSSNNYEKMQKAVLNYKEFLTKVQNRIKDANNKKDDLHMLNYDENKLSQLTFPMDAVITVDDLIEMQRLSIEMRDAAKKYLIGKKILPKVEGGVPERTDDDYEEYTRNRISAARSLLEFGSQGVRIREDESETAMRNQRRAQEEINDLVADVVEHELHWDPEPPKRQGSLA